MTADDLTAALAPRLSADAAAWLDAQKEKIAAGEERALYLGFGLAPRKVGKAELNDERFPGWSVDQAARVALLLAFPTDDDHRWLVAFDKLADAAEVREQVALYRALPLLPFPHELADRAAEGLRTNVKGVFEAIAHDNPFPLHHFNDARWNQMVLKALFIGSSLGPIVGLRERMNQDLHLMLRDYAAERRAAGRDVPADLTDLLADKSSGG
ncbi:EboA domain-containing protein [Alienimonas sp. DA493]|uniref:EboA domain-containing protein n=1 Tax=Alienimonas sp. DA493 TaxID=3373605 RepID=UPI0037544E91